MTAPAVKFKPGRLFTAPTSWKGIGQLPRTYDDYRSAQDTQLLVRLAALTVRAECMRFTTNLL